MLPLNRCQHFVEQTSDRDNDDCVFWGNILQIVSYFNSVSKSPLCRHAADARARARRAERGPLSEMPCFGAQNVNRLVLFQVIVAIAEVVDMWVTTDAGHEC